jgi:response regulator NasT
MSELKLHKVLIVDDERFLRMTIRALLRGIGHFDVMEADDGDVALVKAETWCPDVVLCDVTMPRMGGLRFVEELRKHPQVQLHDTPVLFLTGHNDISTVEDAKRLGVSGYLVKPLSQALLSAGLQRVFGKEWSPTR